MFNPIGSLAAPQPLTLVATALPNTIALRVPADNVPPTVSSPDINNNARGNRSYSPKPQTTQNITLASASESITNANNDNIATYSSNSQTTFLAQLASGDLSPEVNGIFLQYEKLLSYANVKYKPSNAGKPVDPIGIFKTLLQIENKIPNETTLETLSDSAEEPIPTTTNITLTPIIAASEAPPPPPIQILKYQETTTRNKNYEPKNLEVA